LNQKLHSVTADQLYRGKFDGDDSASIERIANDVQVFLREPTADVKDQTPFSRKSVDSARHWLASPFVYPHCFKGKRRAIRMQLKGLEIQMSTAWRIWQIWWMWLIWWNWWDFSET
jgi:hypothetical protein